MNLNVTLLLFVSAVTVILNIYVARNLPPKTPPFFPQAEPPHRPLDREFGLVVVHCGEQNMTFLNEIPEDWLLDVYENCGQKVSPNHSLTFRNRGSEECSAYLDFIVQHYENLPQILIFMQADGLDGYGKPHRNFEGHSPFQTIAQMQNVTRDIMLIQRSTKFLHYGRNIGDFGDFIIRPGDGVILKVYSAMGRIAKNETRVLTRPSATFAVHRDRAYARPLSDYAKLRDWILNDTTVDSREYCWSLENTWHVLFGEPDILPVSSSVDHIPRRIQ